MEDLVSKATKAAIAHAKCRDGRHVTTDDILIGIFKVISRFDIVRIGNLIIDLQDFQDVIQDISTPNKKKVAYSTSVNELFEKASMIAKNDTSSNIQIVHLLVAFADHENGLMGKLKKKYGFSGKGWRAALSTWHAHAASPMQSDVKPSAQTISSENIPEKLFYSPDEAAVFLSVHVQTIRGYIRTGKLPAMRLAGERAFRIKKEDLLALFEPYNPE